MLQATIIYNLTEETQRALMAEQGQPVTRKQTTTVDVSPEDLTYYPVKADGTIEVDLTTSAISSALEELRDAGAFHQYAATPNVPRMVRELREQRQAVREELRAFDAAAAEYIEAGKADSGDTYYTIDRAIAGVWEGWSQLQSTVKPADRALSLLPLSYAAMRRRSALLLAEHEAKCKRETAERKREEAEAAAKEQEKTDFIAAWIGENGDEELRAQQADGLLCRKTALKMIADAAFASVNANLVDPYQPDFCDNRDCPCGYKDLYCVPPRVYQRWSDIKVNLPEGTKLQFMRATECPGADEYWDESTLIKRYVVKISMPFGPFQFDRTILLANARD